MPGLEAVRKRLSPTLPWGQSPGRSMTADGWPPLVPRRAPEGARHTPYLLTLLSFTCARPRPRAALNFSESGGTSGRHSVRLCHHGLTLVVHAYPGLGFPKAPLAFVAGSSPAVGGPSCALGDV